MSESGHADAHPERAPDRPNGSNRPDRRFGQVVVLFFVCLLLILTTGIVAQRISMTGGLAFTLVVLVLLPALVFMRVKRVPLREGLRLRAVPPAVLLAGAAAGCGGWALAVTLHGLVARGIGPPPDIGLASDSVGAFLALLVAGALLPGVCEEVLFRGVIQGVLERRGKLFAVLLTSALFGLFHLDPWRLLPATLLGVIFGWLTVRTGSLVPAIVAHAANNATAFSVAHTIGEPPGWLLAALAALFAGAAGVVVVRTGAPSGPPAHPLALVPAGLSRPVAWIGGLAGALVATPILAGGALIAVIVTTAEATDDALAPHVKAGDTLVLVRSGTFAFDPEPGETVALRRDGETLARVVARVEDGTVIVRDGERELRVPAGDLVGELVHVIPRQ